MYWQSETINSRSEGIVTQTEEADQLMGQGIKAAVISGVTEVTAGKQSHPFNVKCLDNKHVLLSMSVWWWGGDVKHDCEEDR